MIKYRFTTWPMGTEHGPETRHRLADDAMDAARNHAAVELSPKNAVGTGDQDTCRIVATRSDGSGSPVVVRVTLTMTSEIVEVPL